MRLTHEQNFGLNEKKKKYIFENAHAQRCIDLRV